MRNYILVSIDELDKVNFDYVLQSETTLMYYVKNDNEKIYTVLKWEGENPEFLSSLNDYIGVYDEFQLLSTIENDFYSESDGSDSDNSDIHG